jgi:hypothetical protein
MSGMTRVSVLVAAVLASFVAAVWLYTYDVHVPITGNGPANDSFCGSAYDVVFLKEDGYMGGEMPPNQEEIDAACLTRAKKYVAAAAGAGLLGTGLLVPLGLAFRRRPPVRLGRAEGQVGIETKSQA